MPRPTSQDPYVPPMDAPRAASRRQQMPKRTHELRRFWACAWKNVVRSRPTSELDLDCLPLLGGLDFEVLPVPEAEEAADDVRRELVDAVVVLERRVVVVLSREADTVLRRRELFLQCQHVLVGLELRVGFGHREERPQSRGELSLGLALLADSLRVDRDLACLDHRLER